MDNPRKAALASLIKAELAASYSNLEINSVISRGKMSRLNVALYTALYLGVTERLITLDYVISKYSSKPIEDLDVETKNALRLGIYQLMYMDKIPEYSAVSETVNLCPRRSKGFVNAILRNFLRQGKELVLPQDKWQALSIETSIPMSLIDILRSSYGDERALTLSHALTKPRAGTTIRINTLKNDPREMRRTLKARGISYTQVGFSDELLVIKAPISDFVDLIDNGMCFVQDTASFACVKILSPSPAQSVLDACACPGGKSFSSAMDMKNEGRLVCCDLHKNKLSLVTGGAQKLGIDIITVYEQDAKKQRDEFIGAFDKVLCDVPCSGLGIISKKPDIKYKSIEDIENLPSVQLEILKNCAKYVKVGGELVYSTCTLNKKENEDVVAAFISADDSFSPLDFEVGEIKSKDGAFTFMPDTLEADGFFVAKLKRIK